MRVLIYVVSTGRNSEGRDFSEVLSTLCVSLTGQEEVPGRPRRTYVEVPG